VLRRFAGIDYEVNLRLRTKTIRNFNDVSDKLQFVVQLLATLNDQSNSTLTERERQTEELLAKLKKTPSALAAWSFNLPLLLEPHFSGRHHTL